MKRYRIVKHRPGNKYYLQRKRWILGWCYVLFDGEQVGFATEREVEDMMRHAQGVPDREIVTEYEYDF